MKKKTKFDEFEAAKQISNILRQLDSIEKCNLAIKWAKEVVDVEGKQ